MTESQPEKKYAKPITTRAGEKNSTTTKMNTEEHLEQICRASTQQVAGIVMMPVSESALISAIQWIRKIHENRDEPLIKGWMRHDADPLPVLKELEEARMVSDVVQEVFEPLPEIESQDRARTPHESMRRIRGMADMSASLMRDKARTGGWEGAEKVARQFDEISKEAKP